MCVNFPQYTYYSENREFPTRLPRFTKTTIQLIDVDTCSAAVRITKPCILSFASAVQPGGGWESVKDVAMPIKTQEEDVWRRSNMPEMMDWEEVREKYPLKGLEAFYCPAGIYKDASLNYHGRHDTGIITMPAVINPNEEDHPLVKAKARRVLQIAAHHNHYIPILGAWGCGVFGNSPEDIAKTFKDLIKGEFHGIFKKVLFAVPGRESHNYKMFNESLFSGV